MVAGYHLPLQKPGEGMDMRARMPLFSVDRLTIQTMLGNKGIEHIAARHTFQRGVLHIRALTVFQRDGNH